MNKIELDQKQIPDKPLSLPLMQQIRNEVNFNLEMANQLQALMEIYKKISVFSAYFIATNAAALVTAQDVNLVGKKITDITEVCETREKKIKENAESFEAEIEAERQSFKSRKMRKNLSKHQQQSQNKKQITKQDQKQTQKQTQKQNHAEKIINTNNVS